MGLRIAFFTPLAPLQSALADHSEGLLPSLARQADIDLFIDEGYRPTSRAITGQFRILSFKNFARRAAEYDLPVYVMGNNHDFHGYIHEIMRDHPGVVLFHDTDFQHYFVGRTLQRGDVAGYLAEMEYAYGLGGREAAASALAGDVEKLRGSFPLVERLLDWNRGAIVYNHFALDDLQHRRPGACVRRVNYHFYLPPGFPAQVDTATLRQRWGVEGKFVIGNFGLFIPDKRIEVCLRAFRRFLESQPDAHFLLVGNHAPTYDVPGMIRREGLEKQVTLTGWMDTLTFTQHLCLPDVAVHLRYPHIGGTLYTPIRLLGLGQPTILSDIEPLAGFPEGCCAKVPPDHGEEDLLVAILERLAVDHELRVQMGQNARKFVDRHHGLARIAQEHLSFFEQVASGTTPAAPQAVPGFWSGQLVRDTAAILAQWDAGSPAEAEGQEGAAGVEDELLRPIAAAIAELTGGA
jgi:glycosyltransferase involved in cell wall biosynthesis